MLILAIGFLLACTAVTGLPAPEPSALPAPLPVPVPDPWPVAAPEPNPDPSADPEAYYHGRHHGHGCGCHNCLNHIEPCIVETVLVEPIAVAVEPCGCGCGHHVGYHHY